jgi:SAM-dependent methyltransferase
MDVSGIDLSDGMIQVARERGVKNVLKMSACDLDFPEGNFDTAIAFGNNFGLCGSPEGVMRMLLRLRVIVSEGGRFLAESIDPLNTTSEIHRAYHERNKSRGRMPGQVTLRFAYKDKVGDWFELLLVTPTEMKILAERTGWSVERTFYDPESGPLFVSVLRRT